MSVPSPFAAFSLMITRRTPVAIVMMMPSRKTAPKRRQKLARGPDGPEPAGGEYDGVSDIRRNPFSREDRYAFADPNPVRSWLQRAAREIPRRRGRSGHLRPSATGALRTCGRARDAPRGRFA